MNIVAAPRRTAFPVRYRVVAFLVSLAALTYLDRVCISVLAPRIMARFQPLADPDELRLQRLHARLRHLRDPDRVVGRPRRQPPRPRPHRRLVVHLHHAQRRGLQLRLAAGRAPALRSRRGRRLAQRRARLLPLDPGRRARHRAGHLLRRRASLRRHHPGSSSPGCSASCSWRWVFVCCGVGGLRLDGVLVSLVPRRARRPSLHRPRRSPQDRERAGPARRPRRRPVLDRHLPPRRASSRSA